MSRRTRPVGLAPRLFAAQALIVLAGATTLVVVLFLVAPTQFHTHLRHALGTVPSDLATHIDRAFETAVLVSLAVAIAASLLTTMVVSWFVTRRITRPVRQLADAADLIAAGRYQARVPSSGLGSEFDRLDAAFNAMGAQLASTERRRRALLSDLAHELRTPIATLDGFLEGLEDGVIAAEPRTWMTLRDQTARLRRLVEDVGVVSEAEERGLDLAGDPVDLAAVAADAVRGASPAYRDKGVRLDLAGDPVEVAGDPDRLREVVDNLLANALRHTPGGGRVQVTVRATRDAARLEVADDGEGVAPEDLPHLFERFYRGDSARVHDTEGSGIGLSIARALVHAHGGAIAASSDGPGRGAVFAVALPRHAPTTR